MINYDYICQACGYELNNVLQSIKDKPKKRCPKCRKHKLERVMHGGVYGFVNNASTIGQLADKNASDMGHYQKSEIEAKAKENKPKSKETVYGKHATASRTEINHMSNEQKHNYIMKGK